MWRRSSPASSGATGTCPRRRSPRAAWRSSSSLVGPANARSVGGPDMQGEKDLDATTFVFSHLISSA